MNRVTQIQPELVPETSAFDLARATCELWGQVDFDESLDWHFQHGFVAIMPHLFLLAKVIELADGRRAWFITHAVGELALLLALEPFPLEWIAFRRRFDSRIRIYRLDRLRQLAFENLKRNQEYE
jgi:hypothetical protein